MASVKDIKAHISNLATLKQQNQQVREQTTKEEVINSSPQPMATPHEELNSFLKKLVPGKDFGNIPNVKQPILFKAGAQKILKFLGYRYSPQLVDKTIDASTSLLAYTVKVSILDKDGNTIVESLGSANSCESKFASRGLSSDNMLVEMAVKRALITGVREIISK